MRLDIGRVLGMTGWPGCESGKYRVAWPSMSLRNRCHKDRKKKKKKRGGDYKDMVVRLLKISTLIPVRSLSKEPQSGGKKILELNFLWTAVTLWLPCLCQFPTYIKLVWTAPVKVCCKCWKSAIQVICLQSNLPWTNDLTCPLTGEN